MLPTSTFSEAVEFMLYMVHYHKGEIVWWFVQRSIALGYVSEKTEDSCNVVENNGMQITITFSPPLIERVIPFTTRSNPSL